MHLSDSFSALWLELDPESAQLTYRVSVHWRSSHQSGLTSFDVCLLYAN